jgi:hypothetical protein
MSGRRGNAIVLYGGSGRIHPLTWYAPVGYRNGYPLLFGLDNSGRPLPVTPSVGAGFGHLLGDGTAHVEPPHPVALLGIEASRHLRCYKFFDLMEGEGPVHIVKDAGADELLAPMA